MGCALQQLPAQLSTTVYHGQGTQELLEEFGSRFRYVVQGAVVRCVMGHRDSLVWCGQDDKLTANTAAHTSWELIRDDYSGAGGKVVHHLTSQEFTPQATCLTCIPHGTKGSPV